MNDTAQPYNTTPCPECGSQRVWSPIGPQTYLMPKLFSYIRLQALVCINCGHTTLYAEEPERLRQKLRR